MTTRRRSLLVPALILAVALAVIAAIVLTSMSREAPGRAEDEQSAVPTLERDGLEGVVTQVVEPTAPEHVEAERHEEGDPLAYGDSDAPVTIVMFSDFQCSFCALWTNQTLPQIQPLIDDGQVRIEWRDIAVFGENSRRAAYAAYAAGLQGEYQEYVGALFAGGSAPRPKELSDEALEQLAADLGLDVEKFNADRAGDEVLAAVGRNMEEGEELGVFSTPAFLINGSPTLGAQPTEVFFEEIEKNLP